MHWIPDPYTLQARIAPVVLATLPAAAFACGCVVWFDVSIPNFGGIFSPLAGILTLYATSCLLFTSHVGRCGRSKQAALFAKWGGPPLRRSLRHDYDGDDLVSWNRIAYTLEAMTKTTRPSPDAEKNDSKSADQVYADYENELKRATRDAKVFPLVAIENRSFGFRRNLWALKPLVLILIVLMLASVSVLAIWLQPPERWFFIGSAVFFAVVSLPWLFFITPTWVREAADAYLVAMRDGGLTLVQDKPKKEASCIHLP